MEHEEAWNNLKKRENEETHKIKQSTEQSDELRVVEYSPDLEKPYY